MHRSMSLLPPPFFELSCNRPVPFARNPTARGLPEPAARPRQLPEANKWPRGEFNEDAAEHRVNFRDIQAVRFHRFKKRATKLLMSVGDLPAAEASFRKAIDIARCPKRRNLELCCHELRRLRRHQGKRREARDLLDPIYGWFTSVAGTGTSSHSGCNGCGLNGLRQIFHLSACPNFAAHLSTRRIILTG